MNFNYRVQVLLLFIVQFVFINADFLSEFSYAPKRHGNNKNSNLEVEKLIRELRTRRSDAPENHKVNETLRIGQDDLVEEATNPSEKSLEDLRNEIRRRLSEYIHQIEVVHELKGEIEDSDEAQTHHRSSREKRAIITADNQLPGRRRRNITHYESAGIHVVSKVYPLKPQPFTYKKIIDLNIVSIKGDFYAFALEVDQGSTYTCIYKVEKDFNPKEIIRQSTPGAVTIEFIQIEQSFYILPLEFNKTSSKDSGSLLYKFDYSQKRLQKQQTIVTEYAKTIHFWVGLGKEANDVFLAIGPEYQTKPSGSISYKVEVPIYRWQGAYFDYIHSVTAYCPKAIQYALVKSAAFLAVANYQDDTQSTTIYSEIFKYNYKESKYLSFQKILTRGAKDIQFFNFTNGVQDDYYLAIANNCEKDKYGNINYQVKSHILKYGEGRFVPFQSFVTNGAFQILPVKTEEKTLLVIGEITGFRIIQYNGWRFTETFAQKWQSEYNPGLGSLRLRPFLYNSLPYISIASTIETMENQILSVEFEQKNLYNDMTNELEAECFKVLSIIENENASKLVEVINKTPKITDAQIVLSSSLTFSQGLRAGSLTTKVLQYNGILFDQKLSKDLRVRENNFKVLQQELTALVEQLSQVVLRNENQIINTEIHFTGIDYFDSSLDADYVKVDRLNGFKVGDLFAKLIYLDKDYSIVELSIGELITTQNIKVERLNGYALSDFALKSSEYEQLFTSENKFNETVSAQSGFITLGLVDGIDFQTIDFLLKDQNQTFKEPIIIRDSQVNDLVARIINNVDLQYYINEGVSRVGSISVSGNKEFTNVEVTQLEAEYLSESSIQELYDQSARISGVHSQKFEGYETKFEKLSVESLELTENKINDRYQLDDFLSISSGNYYLDQVELLNETSIAYLSINSSLNQVKVYDGKLDLILKNSEITQEIGNKKIDNIVLEKNSYAIGLIDGINLTGWSHEKEIELQDNKIRFNNFAPKGYLSVPDTKLSQYAKFYVGNEDVTKILTNSLTLTSTELPQNFRGTVTFEKVSVGENTELRSINRMNPREWLTQGGEDYGEESTTKIVTGTKTFSGDIKLNSPASATGLFASKDRYSENILNELNDLLIDGLNQTIRKSSIFERLLAIDRLNCPGVILNGVQFKNLFLTTGDQEITGTVEFKQPIKILETFLVNRNVDSSLLNGYDFDVLVSDTLKSSSPFPQIFVGNVVVRDKLTANNFKTSYDSKVDGYNLTELLNNIVSSSGTRAKEIFGNLIFKQEAQIDQIQVSGLINGISSSEWGEGLLLVSGNQVISTPLIFRGSVTADNIIVQNGKISNINFVELANDIVRIDQDGQLGVIYFENEVNSNYGDISVGGTVNGYNLRNDLLLRNSKGYSHEISGKKTFENDIVIEGNLEVDELDQFKGYAQAGKFVYGKTSGSDSLRINGNLNLEKELEFRNTFNNENWNDILETVWFTDQSINFDQKIDFNSIVLENGGELDGTINENIRLQELIQEYISVSRENLITGNFRIDTNSPVIFKDLTTSKLIIKKGQINGITLDEFRNSVLLDGVDQTIESKLSFNELNVREIILEEGSRVGGYDLDKDFVTIHGQNVITATKTIGNLTANTLILGDGTTLNRIYLEEWYSAAAKLRDDQNITGKLEFTQAKFNGEVYVDGYVDGIKFHEDNILTLSTHQTISGNIVFKQNPEYESGSFIAENGIQVNGYFNKYNLTQEIEKLIYKNGGASGPIIVYGEKYFNSPLSTEYLQAGGLYQGYNISQIMGNMVPENYLQGHYNYSLEQRYQDMSTLAIKLHEIADKRAIFLAYYEKTSTFNEITGIVGIKTASLLDKQLLCVTSKTETSHAISWLSYSSRTDSYSQGLISNSVFHGELLDYAAINYQDTYYVLVTVSNYGNTEVKTDLEVNLVDRYGELEKSTDKLSKTYLLKLVETEGGESTTGYLQVHQIIYGYNFGRLLPFNFPNSKEPCALVHTYDKNEAKGMIYCFDAFSQAIRHSQTLALDQPTFSATTTTSTETLLIIGNGGTTTDSGRGGGLIDVYSGAKKGNFQKVDCLQVINLVSLDTVQNINNETLLAVASGKMKRFAGGVYIYKFSSLLKKFEKIQILSTSSTVKVRFQAHYILSSEILLHVMTSEHLYVYTYEGLSGFSLTHTIKIEESFDFEASTFLAENNRIFKSQLITTSQNQVEVYTAALNGI